MSNLLASIEVNKDSSGDAIAMEVRYMDHSTLGNYFETNYKFRVSLKMGSQEDVGKADIYKHYKTSWGNEDFAKGLAISTRHAFAKNLPLEIVQVFNDDDFIYPPSKVISCNENYRLFKEKRRLSLKLPTFPGIK